MISVVFACLVAVVCVYFVRRYPKYKRRKEYLDDVPGPKPYPVVGNGLELTNSRSRFFVLLFILLICLLYFILYYFNLLIFYSFNLLIY